MRVAAAEAAVAVPAGPHLGLGQRAGNQDARIRPVHSAGRAGFVRSIGPAGPVAAYLAQGYMWVVADMKGADSERTLSDSSHLRPRPHFSMFF